jgi:hypothetical protein
MFIDDVEEAFVGTVGAIKDLSFPVEYEFLEI